VNLLVKDYQDNFITSLHGLLIGNLATVRGIMYAYLSIHSKSTTLGSPIDSIFTEGKKVSFMNVPPLTLEMSERVSEATLCFTKQFWNERKFEGLPEGDKFIRGREQMCREISPQNVIVSLIHSKNISSRKSPTEESNGSHYGFCDELFLLLEQISSS
jgi:hypothetical protein